MGRRAPKSLRSRIVRMARKKKKPSTMTILRPCRVRVTRSVRKAIIEELTDGGRGVSPSPTHASDTVRQRCESEEMR